MEQMKTLTIGGKTYDVVDAAAVKTINGATPDENGAIELKIESAVEVDATLTQEGKAADAKATGERLSELSEEIDALKGGGGGGVEYREETITPDIDGCLKTDGTMPYVSSTKRTGYISLKGCTHIEAQCRAVNTIYAVGFFDANKTLMPDVSIIGTGTSSDQIINMSPPAGAAYVMFSHYLGSSGNYVGYITLTYCVESNDNDTTGANPIKGKRFAVLGDSISSVNYTLPVWWQLIAEKYGCEFVNYGVSGSRIAVASGETGKSFTERYVAMDDTVDGVVIVGGTNDSWYTPIGEFNSADNTTLNGALNEMLPGLLNKYPGKPVLFFAPIQREDYTESDYPVTVADLKTLDVTTAIGRDRVNLAIMVKCRQYGVPCVDLYTACGINGNDANSVYFRTDDNLHPSALGMQRIAGVVAAEMVKHFMFAD